MIAAGEPAVVAPRPRNERSILRMSTGKPAQVAERRVAGAEVVHRDPDAERLQVVQALDGRVRVGEHHGLGDLEDERGRRRGRSISSASRTSSTIVSDCSCLTERLTLIREACSRAGRARAARPPAGRPRSSTQRPIGMIRPVSSASGMNCARRDQAARRVLPAEERLDADDRPAGRGGRPAGSRPRAGRCSSARWSSRRSSRRSTTRSCIVGSKSR